MSDGPYKSLPMSSAWRTVAKRGDLSSYASRDISDALIPALTKDSSLELSPSFRSQFSALFREQDLLLFQDQLAPELEVMRNSFGSGLERIVLEYAIEISERGGTGVEAALKAVENALIDRACRGARSVEEHYCRLSDSCRAQEVRVRIEQGIRVAPIDKLARQILKCDAYTSSQRTVVKHRDIEDGVSIR